MLAIRWLPRIANLGLIRGAFPRHTVEPPRVPTLMMIWTALPQRATCTVMSRVGRTLPRIQSACLSTIQASLFWQQPSLQAGWAQIQMANDHDEVRMEGSVKTGETTSLRAVFLTKRFCVGWPRVLSRWCQTLTVSWCQQVSAKCF